MHCDILKNILIWPWRRSLWGQFLIAARPSLSWLTQGRKCEESSAWAGALNSHTLCPPLAVQGLAPDRARVPHVCSSRIFFLTVSHHCGQQCDPIFSSFSTKAWVVHGIQISFPLVYWDHLVSLHRRQNHFKYRVITTEKPLYKHFPNHPTPRSNYLFFLQNTMKSSSKPGWQMLSVSCSHPQALISSVHAANFHLPNTVEFFFFLPLGFLLQLEHVLPPNW